MPNCFLVPLALGVALLRCPRFANNDELHDLWLAARLHHLSGPLTAMPQRGHCWGLCTTVPQL